MPTPSRSTPATQPQKRTTGVLPLQAIARMLEEKEILAAAPIIPEQLQPASLDLRLGKVAYRVRASFLPGAQPVLKRIEDFGGYPIDLENGAVLEKGCVYIIPLLESLDLKSEVAAFANPKSSTGRIDVLTRLIADGSEAFDRVERGYKGPLYIEVAPRTFSIVVRTGSRLNQLRFRRGSPAPIALETFRRLHEEKQIVDMDEKKITDNRMLSVSVDLSGNGKNAQVGFRARRHADRIDVDRIGHYDPLDFWEPVLCHGAPRLILDPDEFYILVTRESVGVPPDYAAEMVAYDTSVGEFRVHYAGFFDPGFGWDGKAEKARGSRAVLEVRSHEVPFLLEHGQMVGWLRYEPMAARPDKLYGQDAKSNYQNQGLKLAKQFRAL